MTLTELQRLEAIVDEARRLQNKLNELTTLRERVLELHGPQPANACKSFRLQMESGHCDLIFSDSSNALRTHCSRLAVSDGINLVEMFLEFLDNRIDVQQRKLEELQA